MIQAKSIITEYFLGEMSKQLAAYNNIIIGSNNSMKGTSNVIIGNNNKLNKGTLTNSYVFSSNLNLKAKDKLDKTLILDDYLVEFLKTRVSPLRFRAKNAVRVLK